jgi:hypothetical protein
MLEVGHACYISRLAHFVFVRWGHPYLGPFASSGSLCSTKYRFTKGRQVEPLAPKMVLARNEDLSGGEEITDEQRGGVIGSRTCPKTEVLGDQVAGM